MHLGIGSYTYSWAIGVPGRAPQRPMTAMDLLDRGAELGVRLVQVADNLPLHELSDGDLDRFEEQATGLGICVEVGTRGIAPDHLRAYLRLAVRLGSPILRVVIDTLDHRPPEDEIVGTLRGLMPEFERAGVVLAIENHDRFTARAFVRMLQRIGSDHAGICLDTVNSFGALEGPEVAVDVLGPWAVNLHIKDFSISRASHRMGFTVEGRPAGQGRLDIPSLLQRLDRWGRDPNAILELWPPPEETLGETIAKESAWAVESIAYLRQYIPG
ncbi:MAG: sugar phosphate isomerase/epimerase [Anaerolineae bacterium]|nr:sugar phosphate isomerase/epimerase [Anaerolineae bacterium]